ncbi:MAG: hypothetical protein ACOCP8_03515 [archaeon]
MEQWDLDLTSRKAREKYADKVDFERQEEIEHRVTGYIQGVFSFCVIEVPTREKRLLWESRLISTISLCDGCKPSSLWLGKYSPKKKIKDSGLWQTQELYKKPFSDEEVVYFKKLIKEENNIQFTDDENKILNKRNNKTENIHLDDQSENSVRDEENNKIDLVENIHEVKENIKKFNNAVKQKNKYITDKLSFFKRWYYDIDNNLFAPSKFIGYRNMTPEKYQKFSQNKLDGRETKNCLKRLSKEIKRD